MLVFWVFRNKAKHPHSVSTFLRNLGFDGFIRDFAVQPFLGQYPPYNVVRRPESGNRSLPIISVHNRT